MTGTPIAVFGSSEPHPGEALYERARELGVRLAGRAYVVVTGGYGGVMEAASRGACEAGGETLGVTCESFADRQPNAYLTRRISAPDLPSRQRELIDRSCGFVVLDGRAGTLAELTMLWALERAGCLGGRPVILFSVCWEPIVDQLSGAGILEPGQLAATHVVPDPSTAVATLDRLVGARTGS